MSSTLQTTEDGAALPRVAALDGVRGVAILLTLVFHTFDSTQSWGIVGERGVDLFFVLSGFLITGILVETRDQPGFFANFYARRAVRILPLYYLFVALMLFVVAPAASLLPDKMGGVTDLRALADGPSGLWTVWVYLQNFVLAQGPRSLPGLGHLWSLAIEEQFYLFWPLVVAAIPASWRFRAFSGIVVATFLLRTGLVYAGALTPEWQAREYTFTRIDSLVIGAIGALYVRDAVVRQRLEPARRALGRRRWLALVAFAWLPTITLKGNASDVIPKLVYGPGLTFVSVAFLLYVLGAYTDRLSPWATRFTNSRLNLTLGKYSYAIYLFHFPIAAAMKERSGGKLSIGGSPVTLFDSFVNLAVAGGLSLLIARVTWVVWEQPWLRLKRRFAYTPVGPAGSEPT